MSLKKSTSSFLDDFFVSGHVRHNIRISVTICQIMWNPFSKFRHVSNMLLLWFEFSLWDNYSFVTAQNYVIALNPTKRAVCAIFHKQKLFCLCFYSYNFQILFLWRIYRVNIMNISDCLRNIIALSKLKNYDMSNVLWRHIDL